LTFASRNNNASEKTSSTFADAIYYGGVIVTMEGDNPTYAEAVAVINGKIVFVGSKADIEKMHGDNTTMNDLKGKTLPIFFPASRRVLNNTKRCGSSLRKLTGAHDPVAQF
jgi:hypothetical protein